MANELEEFVGKLKALDVENAPRSALVPLLVALAATQTRLAVSLVANGADTSVFTNSQELRAYESGEWITVKAAAERYPFSARWFYRRTDKLPFIKRVSTRKVLVHEPRLLKWLKRTG